MTTVKKTLPFAVFMMILLLAALYLIPDASVIGIQITTGADNCITLNGIEQHTCFTEFAVRENNRDICKRIENPYYMDKCYSRFAEKGGCEKITTPDLRGECFSGQAIEQSNYQVCFQAVLSANDTVDGSSDRCFLLYSLKKKENVCENIMNSEFAGNCLSYFAIENGNPNICESDSTDSKNSCLLQYAMSTMEIVVCDSITGYLREDCYYQLAVLSLDESLCQHITDQDLLEACISETG